MVSAVPAMAASFISLIVTVRPCGLTIPRKIAADRFGSRTTLPSGCTKNLTRSPGFSRRCSRMALGIVACPLAVMAASTTSPLLHFEKCNTSATVPRQIESFGFCVDRIANDATRFAALIERMPSHCSLMPLAARCAVTSPLSHSLWMQKTRTRRHSMNDMTSCCCPAKGGECSNRCLRLQHSSPKWQTYCYG